MSSRTIVVKNCNNIKNAELTIYENKLNIFYGKNGTGKSTIARALSLKSKSALLDSLRPYGKDTDNPSVNGLGDGNIVIFDEKYVNQYVYQKDTLIENAFKVFIETEEYINTKNNIDVILAEIRNTIKSDKDIVNLRDQIQKLEKIIKRTSTGKISKTGGVKGVLAGKGGITNLPQELVKLEPFFQHDIVLNYTKWRSDGNQNFGKEACCPYCSKEGEEELKVIDKVFSETFDKDSVEFANNVIIALTELENYIYSGAVSNIKSLFGCEAKKDDLEVQLSNIVTECTYFSKKLTNITDFNGSSVNRDNIASLENILHNMRINSENLPKYFTSEKTKIKIDEIDKLLDKVLTNVNELKKEIGKYNKYIENAISSSESDINTFLKIAGINYKFSVKIEKGTENSAQAILEFITPDNTLEEVKTPNNHLSWGEKNAFALVMFMFDTLSKDDVSLIILDDPISSFDTDKKYAITDRLLKTGKKPSFYQKTVLMLTHDLEPIINYVQTTSGGQTPGTTKAYYIKNTDGDIGILEIKKGKGLISYTVLLKELATDENVHIAIRIASLRKYIEHNYKNPNDDSLAYHVLSSLIHGRETINRGEGKENLTEEEKERALEDIKKFVTDFEYNNNMQLCSPKNLIKSYLEENNSYFKILLLRAYIEREEEQRKNLKKNNPPLRKYLDETYHIENDYMYTLDFRNFDIVPPNFIKEADNFVNSISTNYND